MQADVAEWSPGSGSVYRQTVLLQSRRVLFGRGTAEDPLRIVPGWLQLGRPEIVACGEGDPPDAVSRDPVHSRDRHDLGDLLLAPAFVDGHTHLALVALRQRGAAAAAGNLVEDFFYRFESKLSADDVAAFTRVGAWESLLSGVGMVWDHYFHGDAVANAIAEVGLTAVVAPTLQDLGGPGVGIVDAQLEATERIAHDDELRSRGIVAALGPHATDTVSAELFARAIALADAEGLPLHLHLAQSPEEVRRVQEREGLSPLRYAERVGLLERTTVFAHGLFVRHDELGTLANTEARLVSCPHSQNIFGFPARVDHWERSGTKWIVATDCAASNDSMSVRKELRFLRAFPAMHAAFSPTYESFLDGSCSASAVNELRVDTLAAESRWRAPEQLLRRVLALPGHIHSGQRAGVLAPGALANVVAYDLDHPSFWPGHDPLHGLVMSDVDAAIHGVWTAGVARGELGDFARAIRTSHAYEEHHREAAARLANLLA